MDFKHSVLIAFSILGMAVLSCQAPVNHRHAENVEKFRVAKQAGRFDECRFLLADSPRIWYDKKEGEGGDWNPLKSSEGRWSAWDKHFRGTSERVTDWQVFGASVYADFFEMNEYFKLTERGGGRWRGTYFIDEQGKISGFMVSGAPGAEAETQGDRREEFEAWAIEHHTQEAAYLMPEGSIDPTDDRAPRMRALLNKWRGSVGLETIE